MPGKKALFLFFTFSFIWLWKYNGFQVIRYLEEIQLFRIDSLYLQNHLSRPGGVIQYTGAFLTQFFYLPWLGALILSVLFVAIYLLLYFICNKKGQIQQYFIFLFPVPVLLLFSCNTMFQVSFPLAIIFNLVLFLSYLYLPEKYRQASGVLLFVVSWFVTGGLFFLLGILLLMDYLQRPEKSVPYITLLILSGLILPSISYYYLYVTSWDKLWYSLTTLDEIHPNKLYIAACTCIPLTYLLGIFLSKIAERKNKMPAWWVPGCYLLLLLSLALGFIFCTHLSREEIARMTYEVEKGNWEKVLEMSSKFRYRENTHNVQKVTYFTNLALSEQGKLMEEMFCYQQLGPAGLFPGRKKDYQTCLTRGEMYYRLGIIPAAEHCAFEAFVVSPQEHSSKALRRLVETNAIRKDTLGFEKYVGHFLKSPLYSKWAHKEKESFYQTTQHLSGKPSFATYNDFIIKYEQHEYNVVELLRADTNNRKAFEYLMASLLLSKDLNSFVMLLDRYWERMEYKQMPRYFEEALLLCRYVINNIDEETFRSYPISGQKEKELIEYRNTQEKEKKFRSFYWYYYDHTQALKYETEQMKSRY